MTGTGPPADGGHACPNSLLQDLTSTQTLESALVGGALRPAVPSSRAHRSTLAPSCSGSSWREVCVAFSGQRLAAARVAAGLTQQQLADALGASKARISEWEHDVTQPRASRVPAIARAINVDPLELMADDYEHLDLEALRVAAGLSRQALIGGCWHDVAALPATGSRRTGQRPAGGPAALAGPDSVGAVGHHTSSSRELTGPRSPTPVRRSTT